MKAFKTDEELAAIPLDKPVLVELPTSAAFDLESETPQSDPADQPDDGAKRVEADLAALKAERDRERQRAARLEREAEEARRLAAAQKNELESLRVRSQRDEGDLIASGLAAAQAERSAAEAELERAFEAGDAKAQAAATAKISRASAKIINFEAGAAELAERKDTVRTEPERREPERREPVAQDFVTAINANPNLLPAEKEWMIRNQSAFNDPDFNKELDVAYTRAIKKEGLVRGTPAYFDYIEQFTGLKKAGSNDGDDERNASVSAPVNRQERGSDGRPSSGKIMLSPEQREVARSLGVSDIEYARQVAAFEQARKADPDKYR